MSYQWRTARNGIANVLNMEVQSWTKGSRIAGKNSKRRTESQPNCHRVSFTLLTEGRAGVIVVGVGALGGANVGADLKG